jgi:hypothetical protein
VSSTFAPSHSYDSASDYPVSVHVEPEMEHRGRVSTFFRIFLVIPHLILVGGPLAVGLSWGAGKEQGQGFEWSGSGGIYGAIVFCLSIVAWLVLLFTRQHPDALYRLAAHFLRWRVRVNAYLMLLTDDYPPFGDGAYPAQLELVPPTRERDFTAILFRMIFVLPQLVALWVLGIMWGITTVVAWFTIVFTGSYPEGLYRFGVGALRWSTRVEAYILLLTDEYPPFAIGR